MMDPRHPSTEGETTGGKPSPLRVPMPAAITLLVFLSITVLAWYVTERGVQRAAYADFQGFADKTVAAVSQRMNAYEQVLRGGIGLFRASDRVSRQGWTAYVESLKVEENFPGIQGIGFALHIPADQLDEHVRAVRAEGFPGYTVRPPGNRAAYTAIVYLEPFNARNQRAFGYDMFSEPTRRAAMERARDSGETTVSGKVTLVQETSRDVQAGVLMYLPLYAKGMPIDSVQQRREALLGYVYSPFRMRDLMRGILGEEKKDIDLEVYDGTRVSSDTLMYDEDGLAHALDPNDRHLFQAIRKIDLHGHVWTLVVTTTPAFEAHVDRHAPIIVGVAGILISILSAAVVWALGMHRTRALALAHSMTTAVREREAFIQAILTNAADGIVTIDDHGVVLSFNRAAEQIFGYRAEEVVGSSINMLMPEPYRSQHDGHLARYRVSGIKRVIGIGREVTGLRKDGSEFPMDLAVSEVIQEGRRTFAGIVRDITERQRAQDALRRSEERFDLAIRGANDGLWDWDMLTNKVYFSPRWKSMLGYGEAEIGDDLSEWSKRVHPEDMEQVMRDIELHIEGKTPFYSNEHRVRHKDGHYLWILDRGIAQRDKQGRVYRMVGIHTDITERKRVEKLKSEFVSTVSHELRTPLTSIRGSLGLVLGGVAGPLTEQGQHLLGIAAKNTERLLALINDILDMEKIQSGRMEFQLETVELMPLVEQCVETNRAYAQQFGVTLAIVATVAGAKVEVDSGRLMQVLANLLSNAAKFSHPGGTVEIAVSRVDDKVRVAVTDHGEGIPETFRERIFEKFSQADSSDSRHKGGTGLGLSISRAIIRTMGGEIDFETQVGKGTTFYFVLPLRE